jgi:thiamine biosynthesis lipoprotein
MSGIAHAVTTHSRSAIFMDTLVMASVVSEQSEEVVGERIERAFGWFAHVEQVCSRFDPESELARLARHANEPVPVSPLLFEAIRFAIEVSRITGGLFDPTIGHALTRRGFNRNYRTGQTLNAPEENPEHADYRDVALDPAACTVTFRKPLALDLGAVAKGLAIDLAVKELDGFSGAVVEAGGDLHARGRNEAGEPWRVGIRHPRQEDALIAALSVSDMAVCTSGDYERRGPRGDGHHLIDPHSGASVERMASVTVIAPTAMVADALATAAFVLGPTRGLRFLEAQGVDALVYSSTLERYATPGLAGYLQ